MSEGGDGSPGVDGRSEGVSGRPVGVGGRSGMACLSSEWQGTVCRRSVGIGGRSEEDDGRPERVGGRLEKAYGELVASQTELWLPRWRE